MSSKLCLKLLIDCKTQKVLFAEAGKEFVDFLFSLLALPMGVIIKLLTKDLMVGCIASVYESLKSLDDTYFHPKIDRNGLLNPRVMSAAPTQVTLLLPRSTAVNYYYKCGDCENYFTDARETSCPSCRLPMRSGIQYVDPESREDSGGGYMKGVVTYTVMDDLTVMPMSTISCITMLNKLNVKDVGELQERTVRLGMYEGLRLLKASLQSATVLTDVFLAKKMRCGAGKS